MEEPEEEHITGLDREESEGGSSIHPDAECDICGSPENDSVMLLCSTDKCEARQHTFCCEPPLKRVPAGDWFCPKCAVSEEEGSLVDDGIRGGKKRKQSVNPGTRVGKNCRLHTESQERPAKRDAQKAKRTTKFQGKDESQNAVPTEADYDSAVDPEKECDVCGSPKDSDVMLLCSTLSCKRGQHTFCCSPKLAKVPSGDWFCPDCTGSNSTANFEAVAEMIDDGVRCTLLSKSVKGLKQCIAERQAGYRRCAYHRGQKVQQMKRFKKRKQERESGKLSSEPRMGQWCEGLIDDGVRCTKYSRREGDWVYQCVRSRAPGFKSCSLHCKNRKTSAREREQLSVVGSGPKFVIKRQPLKTAPRANTDAKGSVKQTKQVQEGRNAASKGHPKSSASTGKGSKRAAPGMEKQAKVSGTERRKAVKAKTARSAPSEEVVPAAPVPMKEVTTPSGSLRNAEPTAVSPSNDGLPFDPVSLFLRDEPVTPPQQHSPVSKSPGGNNPSNRTPPEAARLEHVSLQAQEAGLLMGLEERAKETGEAKESPFVANSELLRKLVAEEVQRLMQGGAFPQSPPPGKLAASEAGEKMNENPPLEEIETAAGPVASSQLGNCREPERSEKGHHEKQKIAHPFENNQAPPELERARCESAQKSETQRTDPLEQAVGQAAPTNLVSDAGATSSPPVQERAPSPGTVLEQETSENAKQTAAEQTARGTRTESESERKVGPECAESGSKDGDLAAEKPFEEAAHAETAHVDMEEAALGDGADVWQDAEKKDGETPSEAAELLDSTQGEQRKQHMANPFAAMRRRSFEEACHALAGESPLPKPLKPDLDLNGPQQTDGEARQIVSPNGSFSQNSAVTGSQLKETEEAAKSPAPAKSSDPSSQPELRAPKEEPGIFPNTWLHQSGCASVSESGSLDATPKTSAVTDSQKGQPQGAEEADKSQASAKPPETVSEPGLLVPKAEPGASPPFIGGSTAQSGCPTASMSESDARPGANATLEPEPLVPEEKPEASSESLVPPAASASVFNSRVKDARPRPFEALTNLKQFWKRPRLNLQ